jgi:DNA topoisomerase-3
MLLIISHKREIIMRLFIAEKKSAAIALALHLGNSTNGNGYFVSGDDFITWCQGHLFESPYPEYYNPAHKEWNVEHLPIIPVWKIVPKEDTKRILKIIGELLLKSDSVVHAGDPDNEGQLIVDDVLEYFNYKKPVQRFWVSAQDTVSVQRGLDALKNNDSFSGHRFAARARGWADWLIGINFSRAYTLQSQSNGVKGVISVGRVQTPTLEIVASRDKAIFDFKSIPFHTITAKVNHANGDFAMKWVPKKDQSGLDFENRLIDTVLANSIVKNIANKQGVISEYIQEPKSIGHPKGLSLTGVSVLASNAFGYNATEVLAICQALYDAPLKLTSYPRTDCEYLPESQFGDALNILTAIGQNLPATSSWVKIADVTTKSKIWDDKKITAHHGIIPTAQLCDMALLTPQQKNVYQLIVRQYIAQFFPLHRYLHTRILASVESENFSSSGRVIIENGWKSLFPVKSDDDDSDEDQALPLTKKNDSINFISLVRNDRKTSPPKYFTEATLLEAMEDVHKFIENPEDKKALKEGDGIGTPATRDSIINEHKKRGNFYVDGKYIKCSNQGFSSLSALPPEIKSPLLTAVYERQLKDIVLGKIDVQTFLNGQIKYINEKIVCVKKAMPIILTFECPNCKVGRLKRISGDKGFFWGCSSYRQGCKTTFPDANGKPNLAPKKQEVGDVYICPLCKKGKMKRVQKKDKSNFFWSCSEWREGCKSTLSDKDEKPVFVTADKK